LKSKGQGASNLRADRDLDFLNRDEVRGVRLELDFLKPDIYLRNEGVEHTIVVFGGTRIVAPDVAERNVLQLQQEILLDEADVSLTARLKIAEKVAKKAVYYEIAREFGSIVGRSGGGPGDCRITLLTGGGPGIMEAANRGAFDVGAKNIGLNIALPNEQHVNPYVSDELCFTVRYFAIRKLHFLLRAKALVNFPGGFGTLDELFEALTLVQTRTIDPLPIILVGEAFWQQAINLDFLIDEGVIEAKDRDLFSYAESAQEAWEQICHWHEAAGSPLYCDDS
jgi:uncharacterized protein (TIGR00730 family)